MSFGKALPLAVFIAAYSVNVSANEAAGSLPSHVHGEATLALAIDKQTFQAMLSGPADNFFGFEHRPTTEEQHATVKQVVDKLKLPDGILTLPAAANCRLESAEVESSLLTEDHDDHDKHAEHAEHADVDATWRYQCQNPKALTDVSIGLFSLLPHLKSLTVQWVTPEGQGAQTLNDNGKLQLNGQ